MERFDCPRFVLGRGRSAFDILFLLLHSPGPGEGDCAGEETLPLSASEFSRISNRFTDTIFATVVGIAAVSAPQGALGGGMFWWLGFPAPVFWGVVMGLVAVVPFWRLRHLDAGGPVPRAFGRACFRRDTHFLGHVVVGLATTSATRSWSAGSSGCTRCRGPPFSWAA